MRKRLLVPALAALALVASPPARAQTVAGRFTRITVALSTCASQNKTVEIQDPKGTVTFDIDCDVFGVHDVSRITLAFDLPPTTPVLASPGLSVSSFVAPLRVAATQTIKWTTPSSPSTPPPYFLDSYLRGPDQPQSCFLDKSDPNVPAGVSTQTLTLQCVDPSTTLLASGENEVGTFSGGFSAKYSVGASIFARYYYDFTPPQSADVAVTLDGPTNTDATSFPITATVTNRGPQAAKVVLQVTSVSEGMSLTFKSATRGDCDAAPFVTTCQIDPLQSGESVRIDFTAESISTKGKLLTVRAKALSTPEDPDPGNNEQVLKTYLKSCIIEDPYCVFALLCGTGSFGRAATALLDAVASLAAASPDFLSLYRLRDEVFARSAAGRRYTELYYAHTAEVAGLVMANPAFRSQLGDAYSLWKDSIARLVAGQGSSAVITQAQIDGLIGVLDRMKALGSPELRAVLEREQALLNLPSLVGRTMDQANAQQQATAPATVTIPAAASIHGIAPAFFHSDLRVLNPSTTSPVTVTARYRCFTGPCPSSLEKTFTVAPRELKVYDDVINTLFAAPETAGAIELVGAILAESRVYTPVKPAPTTGSDVPGLPADEAYAESVLTSLSRKGFRTNVGVYNPGADSLSVSIDVHRPDGAAFGTATRTIGAKSAIQVNDVFGAAGVSGEVADAYAIVKADGVHQLFAYATVIDDQSQDSVFIKGRNARGGEPFLTTIPAAASIHGVPPAFFHSDVRLFNPAPTASEVVARYRCFTGACPTPSPKTISIEPGEMAVLDDIVANLFQAPESAGAIEVTGKALVDSRVYTPTRPEPTTGTGIPGQADVESTTEAALLSLSHSTDTAKGFRTNLGVYNPGPLELSVTLSLRRPDGTEIAKLTRSVPGFSAVQVNNVFAAAGVAADVPAAWALVSGDGFLPFFAYATVIDNQSQDSVYVKGRTLRAP